MTKLYFVAPKAGTYYFRHRPAAGVAAGPGYDRDAIPNVVKQATRVRAARRGRRSPTGSSGTTRYGTSVAVSRQMWNAADDPWWWEGPWGNGRHHRERRELRRRPRCHRAVAARRHARAADEEGRAAGRRRRRGAPSRVRELVARASRATTGSPSTSAGPTPPSPRPSRSQIDAEPFVSMVKRLEGPSRYDTAAAHRRRDPARRSRRDRRACPATGSVRHQRHGVGRTDWPPVPSPRSPRRPC